MSDFDRFKALHIEGRTAWLAMPELGIDVELKLRPANESNKEYTAAKQKLANKRPRMGGKTMRNLEVDVREILRREDRKLFPGNVVVDWKGMKTDAGVDVPFNVEKCAILFQKEIIPDWLFNRVHDFVMFPDNFLPDDEEPADTDALAKNSLSGSSGNSSTTTTTATS